MKASTFALAPLLLATSSQGALTILFGADELKECDQARIQWGGADLPRDSQENVIGSYEVEVSATYQAYESASNQHWDGIYRETRTFNASDELREWPFEVRFPAGININVSVVTTLPAGANGDSTTNPDWNGQANMTIVAGDSQDCIPANHRPIIIETEPLAHLAACEVAPLRWSGGVPPYNLSATLVALKNAENDRKVIHLGQTDQLFFNWTLEYEPGIAIQFINISSDGGLPATALRDIDLGYNKTQCQYTELATTPRTSEDPVSAAKGLFDVKSTALLTAVAMLCTGYL